MNKLAQFLGVRFVTVTLRDIDIASGSAVASVRSPDPIISIEIPEARVVNLIDKDDTLERLVYKIEDNQSPILFTKHRCEYIYDLETGRLLELIVHGKLGL